MVDNVDAEDPAALVEKLIAQGQALTDDLDILRVHSIIRVLISVCILPLANGFLTDTRDKASSIIRILRKQVSRRPDLLRSVSEKDSPAPFYKVVLPQLIYAAARCDDSPEARGLMEELINAAAHVLRHLAWDMQVNIGAEDGRGRLQAARAVKALKVFIQAALQSYPATLYDFKLLSPSPKAALITIRVLVQSRIELNDDTLFILGSAMNALSTDKQVADLFLRTLTAIIPSIPGLDPSVYSILRGDEECTNLLNALPPDTALSAWWDLYSRRANNLDSSRIIFLITPRPRTSLGFIKTMLPDEIAAWQKSDSAEVRQAATELDMVPRKRKRDDVGELLNGIVEHDGDVMLAIQNALPAKSEALRKVFPRVMSTLCNCDAGHTTSFIAIDIWHKLAPDDMGMLAQIAHHVKPTDILALRSSKTLQAVLADCRKDDKRLRLLATRALVAIVSTSFRHPDPSQRGLILKDIMPSLRSGLSAPLHVRASTIHILGALCGVAPEDLYGEMLELLLLQFGCSHMAIKSLTWSELSGIIHTRGVNHYMLFAPHVERISVLIGLNLSAASDLVSQTMRFMNTSRADYVVPLLKYIVPALVVRRRREELLTIQSLCKQPLGIILCDHSAHILARVFRQPRCSGILEFLLECMRADVHEFTIKGVMTICLVRMAIAIIVDLGDTDVVIRKQADKALQQAAQTYCGTSSGKVGDMLGEHMLGVITGLNEELHQMQGKKTGEYKRKIIRSLCALIDMMGDSMSAIAPQIIASLQSTLGDPDLRAETLTTWLVFIKKLKFADSGPFIGRTTAAIVAHWNEFDEGDRALAVKIVIEIAENFNNNSLAVYLHDIADMSHIPRLAAASKSIINTRSKASFYHRVDRLIARMASRNGAVATTALTELRDVLAKSSETGALARGDTFHPFATKIIRGLLLSARDESDVVRALSYECLGILGALDPDRLVRMPELEPMTLLSNYTNHDESAEFAIHLIRDLLVGAFRATYDIKHQTHLAYAVQELLGYCEFNLKMLNSKGAGTPLKIINRWKQLSDVHETVTPLLEARFKISEVPIKAYQHPVYEHSGTYREWVQNWSMALLGKVMAFTDPTLGSKRIFGVLRGVLRHQDVTVAHHILPHLVLHVLLSGEESARTEINEEINTVLHDQVNPTGTVDKRMLSAQVIFDLMDHLSRWLRQARARRTSTSERMDRNHAAIVEKVLSSVETELLANAALQSKAYARSLRNFEQRIIHLRMQGRSDTELQPYHERLHEIYADLDEPDGMEGVSTYILSPSLEHQIREHESTGRWTSAQSCWEVRLQQYPDDLSLHQGLLRCLRNLGHYDTLRTHIRGVVSRQPEWRDHLDSFAAEAAWIIGDWATVDDAGKRGLPMAQVMSALHAGKGVEEALRRARLAIGSEITSTQYSRVYEPILSLHILRELETIHRANSTADSLRTGLVTTGDNATVIAKHGAADLRKTLSDRLDITAPAFRVREVILSARRTALTVVPYAAMKDEIGQAWVLSSKMARKAGYEQTAYSATLQAKEVDAPFAFVQQAKLVRASGAALRALKDLDHIVKPMEKVSLEECERKEKAMEKMGKDKAAQRRQVEMDDERFERERALSKAVLLAARWAHEADRFGRNDIIKRFQSAQKLAQDLESPHYHLGRYYDERASLNEDDRAALNQLTCQHYKFALEKGNKYIYRTMPRMLTIWLDLTEAKETEKEQKRLQLPSYAGKITKMMDFARLREEILPYQWLTAFPQIASRLGHRSLPVKTILVKLLALVINKYPRQALWPMFGLMQSNRPERKQQAAEVTQRALAVQNGAEAEMRYIQDAERFSANMLVLADAPVGDAKKTHSIANDYPFMKNVFPTRMMMPLQDALTGTLPSTSTGTNPFHAEAQRRSHNPFPIEPVTIASLDDQVVIMSSLQKPKKLVFVGSDGSRHPFLCKPHDDLRKDARLMDFNSMINKLLKSASESRRRQLYIRTYAVMPLNEECGLLEWVSNTVPLKGILESGYARHGKKVYSHEVHGLIETGKRGGQLKQVQVFVNQICPMYRPTVFHEWFLTTWPEPSAWLAARMAYARTLAVMSMIGYVLGLGDRHGENILFDGLTGDTVHVDFNCLFDKGKTFEIPERVPFRLTQNMVEAMGVTGVEGVFRKAAEISYGILRTNRESLMSVLEAFVHDPLVEWANKAKPKHDANRKALEMRKAADDSLTPIGDKLRGTLQQNGVISTVPNQVDALIQQATSNSNLGLMYQGWAPWL